MNCLKAEEQFSAYLQDELDYPAVRAFEAHFTNCERCQHEFRLFHESLDLLHQLSPVEPATEFDANLRLRLANTPVESIPVWYSILNALRYRPVWAFSGVAILFAVFAGIYYFYPNTPVTSPLVEVIREPDLSSAGVRSAPFAEFSTDELWQPELPLAVPDLNLNPWVKFPVRGEFGANGLRGAQQPRRVEQNYILQTINYTDVPSGGGL
ncbi:MAG: zf-HC2 domain-containing protein [Candidatus Poribacteria bacterium]|nr:zf-HC2 domain-containing protein [Candidatus Poribacteria bacterium]